MSGAFQLDTSGAVHGVIASDGDLCAVLWDDLSPFTQGYVEAMPWDSLPFNPKHPFKPNGFADLAPETLARIIADCAAFVDRTQVHSTDGAWFWRTRQDGDRAGFPPLTVQLGVDGKVRFAKATGEASS